MFGINGKIKNVGMKVSVGFLIAVAVAVAVFNGWLKWVF